MRGTDASMPPVIPSDRRSEARLESLSRGASLDGQAFTHILALMGAREAMKQPGPAHGVSDTQEKSLGGIGAENPTQDRQSLVASNSGGGEEDLEKSEEDRDRETRREVLEDSQSAENKGQICVLSDVGGLSDGDSRRRGKTTSNPGALPARDLERVVRVVQEGKSTGRVQLSLKLVLPGGLEAQLEIGISGNEVRIRVLHQALEVRTMMSLGLEDLRARLKECGLKLGTIEFADARREVGSSRALGSSDGQSDNEQGERSLWVDEQGNWVMHVIA